MQEVDLQLEMLVYGGRCKWKLRTILVRSNLGSVVCILSGVSGSRKVNWTSIQSFSQSIMIKAIRWEKSSNSSMKWHCVTSRWLDQKKEWGLSEYERGLAYLGSPIVEQVEGLLYLGDEGNDNLVWNHETYLWKPFHFFKLGTAPTLLPSCLPTI